MRGRIRYVWGASLQADRVGCAIYDRAQVHVVAAHATTLHLRLGGAPVGY